LRGYRPPRAPALAPSAGVGGQGIEGGKPPALRWSANQSKLDPESGPNLDWFVTAGALPLTLARRAKGDGGGRVQVTW